MDQTSPADDLGAGQEAQLRRLIGNPLELAQPGSLAELVIANFKAEMIIGKPNGGGASWNLIDEDLHFELDAIRTPPIIQFSHDVYELKEWGLRQEALFRGRLDHAVKVRVSTGQWPKDLNPIEGHLLRLRISAVRDSVAWLAAWGASPPDNVEVIIERLALQNWPALRYSAHLFNDWAQPLVSSVEDPFLEDPGYAS
jgi:hypothetical protein